MTFYENLVTETQMRGMMARGYFSGGQSAYSMTKKNPLPYEEQLALYLQKLDEADCVIVGGASGLSAAG